MKNLLAATALATILLVNGLVATAHAVEAATIVNDSDRNVEFFVKWSNVAYESQKIVLAPGESWHSWSPQDGARFFIRYNSTPGVSPPREIRHRVYTATVDNVQDSGYQSSFRAESPYIIVLKSK